MNKRIFAVILVLFVNSSVQAKPLLLEEENICPAKDLVFATSVFNKSYNSVYKFVDRHEYLFAPLSGAIAGQVVGGIWGAILGGILGALDETAIYLGIEDKHYLIWGIFGAATGQVIYPTTAVKVIGIAVGILLPTKVFNSNKELVTPLIAPGISGIAGYSVLGIPGLVAGIIGGVADEVSIYNDITRNHLMTFSAVGHAAVNLLGWFNPVFTEIVDITIGFVIAGYEEAMFASLIAPIETAENLYTIYGKFLPKVQLDAQLERHAVALVGGQFLLQYLMQKATEYRQDITYNFERLDVINSPAWGSFQAGIINFAVFLVPYLAGQTVASRVDNYFCKKLQHTMEDRVRTELYSGENFLRLTYADKNTTLTDTLKQDISVVTESGSMLITGAVSSVIGGIYGAGIVVFAAPNIFVFSSLYNQVQLFVVNYLAVQQRFYGDKLIDLNSRLVNIIKHDTENIRTIVERDGIEFTKERLQQYYDTVREHEAKQDLWSSASIVWWSVSGVIDYMLNFYLIGREVNCGKVPFDNRSKLQTASWQVSDLLSWVGHNTQTVTTINQSLDRLTALEKQIHEPSTKVLDQIERLTTQENVLILQDVVVKVADRILVAVENLQLAMGKVYAITGETGCGKTSLVSKIKGIKENGISGEGTIYYPLIHNSKPKIVVVSQQDYLPFYSSLQEAIIYPQAIPTDPILKQEQAQEIVLLLAEIGLDISSDLDSEKDWHMLFSGGEKKKIMLISAILQKPDILIIDEGFAAFDAGSLITAQKMLRKYLPNALLLIVDHHAQDNNYDSFYDKELHFSNKSVVLQDVAMRI